MEDLKMTFNQISNMLESVESKFAASSQVSQSELLPAIADILSKMERIVSSQMCLQSESGYDSSSSSQDDSVSSVSTSTPIQTQGDQYINAITTVICRLAPAGVYNAAKATKKRRKKAARRALRIVPAEFATLWSSLQEKDEDVLQPMVTPPCPYPKVDWSKVNAKQQATIPSPTQFPVHGCSEDASFYKPTYVDGYSSASGVIAPKFNRQDPYGTKPGYRTNLGVIGVPAQLLSHGYVYVPGNGGWVLHATVGGEKDVKAKSSPPRRRPRTPWRRRRGE